MMSEEVPPDISLSAGMLKLKWFEIFQYEPAAKYKKSGYGFIHPFVSDEYNTKWGTREMITVWGYPDLVTLPEGALLFVYRSVEEADIRSRIWEERCINSTLNN